MIFKKKTITRVGAGGDKMTDPGPVLDQLRTQEAK